ncbi:MAG: DUF1214 domain-containing protein [Hyphomicrobiales bacterium]
MIFALTAGAGAGWISAVSMIENHGLAAVPGEHQWNERRSAADDPAAPYVLGYFANQGEVPPPITARHFVRGTDESGNRLRGECSYVLQGKIPPARRWSIALMTGSGAAATISASEVIYEADGTLRLSFAPYPVPGNRLRSPAGPYSIALTLQDPLPQATDPAVPLPTLTRGGC